MNRSRLLAVALAGLVVAGTVSFTPQQAEAGWRRGHYAPAYGPRGYGPRYGYAPRPYYKRGYYGGGYYNIPIQAYVAKELEMRENGKAIAQKADELYLQVLEDE